MSNSRIYFTDKQIKKRHFNKETGKYEGYAHSFAKNKDGTPVQMVHVLLPSASKRELQFEPDKSGIDRNCREAYIQVPLNAIKDTKEKRRKVVYLTPTSTFTVYFQSERRKDGSFDSPEKVKLNAKQIQQVYPTSLKSKVKEVQKMTTQNLEKQVTKEKKEQTRHRNVDDRSL